MAPCPVMRGTLSSTARSTWTAVIATPLTRATTDSSAEYPARGMMTANIAITAPMRQRTGGGPGRGRPRSGFAQAEAWAKKIGSGRTPGSGVTLTPLDRLFLVARQADQAPLIRFVVQVPGAGRAGGVCGALGPGGRGRKARQPEERGARGMRVVARGALDPVDRRGVAVVQPHLIAFIGRDHGAGSRDGPNVALRGRRVGHCIEELGVYRSARHPHGNGMVVGQVPTEVRKRRHAGSAHEVGQPAGESPSGRGAGSFGVVQRFRGVDSGAAVERNAVQPGRGRERISKI